MKMLEREFVVKLKLVIVMILFAEICVAQEIESNLRKPNVISCELGGSVIFGLTYDRILYQNQSLFINWHTGIIGVFFPQFLTLNFGSSEHYFEIGCGCLPFYYGHSWSFSGPCGLIGYRYQPKKGGLTFKIYLLKILGGGEWPGISLGGCF